MVSLTLQFTCSLISGNGRVARKPRPIRFEYRPLQSGAPSQVVYLPFRLWLYYAPPCNYYLVGGDIVVSASLRTDQGVQVEQCLLNLSVSVSPSQSVTVIVAAPVPVAVGVPDTDREEDMLTPAGGPEAE